MGDGAPSDADERFYTLKRIKMTQILPWIVILEGRLGTVGDCFVGKSKKWK